MTMQYVFVFAVGQTVMTADGTTGTVESCIVSADKHGHLSEWYGVKPSAPYDARGRLTGCRVHRGTMLTGY